jgi:serine/threonine-protein kinase RsbW
LTGSRSTRIQLTIEADRKNLARVRDFVERAAAELGLPTEAVADVRLSVDEAVANIIMHGYREKGGTIEIEVDARSDTLVVCLRDRAPVYNPLQAPAPARDTPLEERPLGGLGVALMKQNMDSVEHRARHGGGNELVMEKIGIVR